ncbi:hypothetical protein P9112_006230 [Eukaryota sp. TZLM1-RC]
MTSSHHDLSCPEINASDIQLGEKIGEGGFASVYSARWFSLDIAVKMVSLTEEGKKLLKKEIALLSFLNSPAILRVFGIAYFDDKMGIVMERATSSLPTPSPLSRDPLSLSD